MRPRSAFGQHDEWRSAADIDRRGNWLSNQHWINLCGAFVKGVLVATELHEEMADMMSDFPDDNHKTEPVSDLAGLLQQSKNGRNELNTRIHGACEDWLMEYRNRQAKVLQGETRIQGTLEGRRP
jgi:hypothetical protein